MFVDPTLLPCALAAAKEVGLSESAIHILEGRAEGRKSFQDIVDIVKKRGLKRLPVKAVKKDALAYLVFSSGTSGLPKGMDTHHVAYLRANAGS